jgi:hypothetical protein
MRLLQPEESKLQAGLFSFLQQLCEICKVLISVLEEMPSSASLLFTMLL